MNDSQVLELLRRADPAVEIDRDPDGPAGRRMFHEARRRAGAVRVAPGSPELRRRTSGGRRRWIAVAAALAAASLAIALVPDLFSRGSRAYAIQRLPNGVIVVDWSADSFRPNADAIAADLRGYGVDVQLTTVAASPSAVGQVTAIFPGEGSGPPPPGLSIGDAGTPGAFTWRIDPLVFHGPVTLQVAVPPEAGQPYDTREEVFEPGEVLAGLQCALGEPLRAADVAARLPALGQRAKWTIIDPASVRADGYRETHVDGVPDGTVLWGYAVDPGTIELTVAPDGTSLDRFPPAQLSDVPCTPGQAARWK